MHRTKIAPFGTWDSPIKSALIASTTIRLLSTTVDGETIYWLEGRPTEGGRYVLVRKAPDGSVSDVTPAGFNARTRVHEYGGGSYWIDQGVVYFTNFADQRLYEQREEGEPKALTPADVDLRFADGRVDRRRQRIICVREDHRQADEQIAIEDIGLVHREWRQHQQTCDLNCHQGDAEKT